MSRTPRRRPTAPRIGLALAGGGPIGAIYEIGALCALEDSIEGLDFCALHDYVGVSAGAFIAAALANGLTPRAMCSAFIENVGGDENVIDPGLFTQPAWSEYARRLSMAPGVAARTAWQALRGRGSLAAWMAETGRLLPNEIGRAHV